MNSSLVYLVQTDTTVGFSCASHERLSDVKQRPRSKKILNTVDSFKTLNQNTRVPKSFRKQVRRASKTTYIYPNQKSFRLIDKNSKFHPFISKFKILYSTSANLTGNKFDEKFALENSDIIVNEKDGFSEKISSSIYKLSKIKKVKIR
ncbi:Sua5 YciO YrdC YwlC family protein [Arcobacter sp. YIC-310]|uniref:Sua5 YciO YrdC YwlC family protein n=1 Tax=Arcobacter sp. YIC-310 TaxID=3376632 RepID=UPI003C28F5CA